MIGTAHEHILFKFKNLNKNIPDSTKLLDLTDLLNSTILLDLTNLLNSNTLTDSTNLLILTRLLNDQHCA